MIYIFLFTVAFFIILLMIGLFRQKDVFTKLLFLNSATSVASLFICMLGSFFVNSSYIDIALIYFLLSVVASNAYLKYFIEKDKNAKIKS